MPSSVHVVDIGIPPGGPGDPDIGLITERSTDGVPRRGSDSTKFAAGSVLVCGGSAGLTGAVCMASRVGHAGRRGLRDRTRPRRGRSSCATSGCSR